jgi:hypothetical protein
LEVLAVECNGVGRHRLCVRWCNDTHPIPVRLRCYNKDPEKRGLVQKLVVSVLVQLDISVECIWVLFLHYVRDSHISVYTRNDSSSQ